jgi:hypothetical protein
MNENNYCLYSIAHARSGDKGNHANIAVMAYTPEGFRWMKKHLTVEAVQNYFASMKPSRVVRFEAPNVLGLNFLLYDVLAGGASRSLRIDSQGKVLAQALLLMEIKVNRSQWYKMERFRAKRQGKKPKNEKTSANNSSIQSEIEA